MGKLIDLTGSKHGKLTVLRRSDVHITKSGQKKTMWLCKCDCGNTTIVNSQDLRSGHTKSCGCIPTNHKGNGLIDLTGKVFGDLHVIERATDYIYKTTKRETTSPRWLCKCKCGGIAIVQGGNLRSGSTINCGCKKITSVGERKVSDFLIKNNILFLHEYSFSDLKSTNGKSYRFDFAILNSNYELIMLLEYQGEQHYLEYLDYGRNQRECSDIIKREYCNSHNIPLYEIKFNDDLESSLQNLLNTIRNLYANPVPSLK